MQTTSKISSKRYRCTNCGRESRQSTNHYGEIYSRCTCEPTQAYGRHECLEPLPDGMARPEPWKMTTLGDVCDIIEG